MSSSSKNNDNDEMSSKEKLFDSTIHGCGMYFRSETWILKMMWILFGLGSLVYLIYLVTSLLIEYHRFEVTVANDRYQELPARFPAVTICNINSYDEEFSYAYILNKTTDAACFKFTNGDSFSNCLKSNDTNSAIDKFLEKMQRLIANDKSLKAIDLTTYGYDLSTHMMISCNFNGIQCSASDFKQFWSHNYGNCYTFNHEVGNIRKTSAQGSEYGFELVVSKYFKFLVNKLN